MRAGAIILWAVTMALAVALAAEVGTQAQHQITNTFAPIEKAFKEAVG